MQSSQDEFVSQASDVLQTVGEGALSGEMYSTAFVALAVLVSGYLGTRMVISSGKLSLGLVVQILSLMAKGLLVFRPKPFDPRSMGDLAKAILIQIRQGKAKIYPEGIDHSDRCIFGNVLIVFNKTDLGDYKASKVTEKDVEKLCLYEGDRPRNCWNVPGLKKTEKTYLAKQAIVRYQEERERQDAALYTRMTEVAMGRGKSKSV